MLKDVVRTSKWAFDVWMAWTSYPKGKTEPKK